MVLYRSVFHALGILILIFSSMMMIPAMVDFCLLQSTGSCFLLSGLFGGFIGGLLFFACKADSPTILNTKEKILMVLLFWTIMPIMTSLPFVLSPFHISFVDCLFEATSSLTTNGSSVISDIRSFSDGFLLWRSLLQLGGSICFIMCCLYIFPDLKSMHLVPFEHENLLESNRIMKQLKIILAVYLSLILISMFLMVGSGTSAVDSLSYAVASLTTSGVNIDGVYNSSGTLQRINFIMAVLMFVGGCSIGLINNLIYNGFSAIRNKQFFCYTSIILALTVLLSIQMFFYSGSDLGILKIVEKALLKVISSVTASGVSFDESETFGNFMDSVLYAANFIGGCSGSGTGGIKIFRIIIIFLLLKSYFVRLLKTNAVYVPTYAGKKLEEMDVISLFSYFLCYAILLILFSLALSYADIGFGNSVGAVITTMNNNGPFFALHRASALEISILPVFAKSIIIAAMIAGRVEFVLFFMIFFGTFWRRS